MYNLEKNNDGNNLKALRIKFKTLVELVNLGWKIEKNDDYYLDGEYKISYNDDTIEEDAFAYLGDEYNAIITDDMVVVFLECYSIKFSLKIAKSNQRPFEIIA